jgi:hypothetical protein
MPHEAARRTVIRLACFAAVWLVALAAVNVQRGDSRWMTKVGWMALFAVPTILLLWLVQRLTKYRIPWPVELLAMPFAIGALVELAIAIRHAVREA